MSMLVTKKELKEMGNGLAIDITYLKDKEIKELRQKEGYFNEIAWSRGMYGVTGLLLQGNNTKQLYKITERTSAIFAI